MRTQLPIVALLLFGVLLGVYVEGCVTDTPSTELEGRILKLEAEVEALKAADTKWQVELGVLGHKLDTTEEVILDLRRVRGF